MDLVKQKAQFDSQEFRTKYHCSEPLGVFCTQGSTRFHLWAPTASAVTLRIYEEDSSRRPLELASLHSAGKGLWVCEIPRSLEGFYYDYVVTADGFSRITADPYGKACGVNGRRNMILDLRHTDPDGWQHDAPPPHTPDQIIYELHVKDFSWDPAGGFDANDRGKFSALCRSGTTLCGDGIHPTGLDYLKTLGVTHIQLLPIFDYATVDEAGSDEQYNWGYDPASYNIPEGSYSSDPSRGDVRIRELKEAIMALHKSGFRVIMDVVYNHTYHLDSSLWRTVPWYFYRQWPNGAVSNGSGCGNELATERSMCARYITDSVLYWAEEYHIDGFRFDLMGLLDTDLIDGIQAALDERFGRGEKLIYGEPWRADNSAISCGAVPCTKDNAHRFSSSVGTFCDSTRDSIKGSLMSAYDRGFVNGGGIYASKLYHCIAGWAGGSDAYLQAPSQTISYLSCHDDWTLWDKLVVSMDPEQNFETLDPDILRANRMAASILFCCLGRTFIHAGEEFGRTKNGVKNSYRSHPDINRLDWTRAWENRELVEYYRGLIALRMMLPGLHDKSAEASSRIISAVDLAPNCVGLTIRNTGGDSPWDKILLLCNGGDQHRTVPLPSGRWQLLSDDLSSRRWETPSAHEGSVTIPPISAWIMGRTAE